MSAVVRIRDVSSYREIEGYPDIGIERNLTDLGIDPFTATFRLADVPVAEIGWYTRERHLEELERIDAFVRSHDLGVNIPPIIVVSTGHGYTVPDGYHRLHAARRLGLKTIRAYVVTA